MGFLVLLIVIVIVALLIKAAGRSSRPTIQPSRPPARVPSRAPSVSTSARPSPSGPPTTAQALEQSARAWVPPGQSAQFGNLELPGGMLYVGRQVQALRGWAAEPALVDPSLRVEPPHGLVENMGYWPSYADISPANRGAYVQWLAGGRRERPEDMGIPFLFLYGLERRLLFDAGHLPAAKAEVPALVREVERLLDLFKDHNSFRGYASQLLEFVRAREMGTGLAEGEPAFNRSGWEMPFDVRMALAVIVRDRRPIPADWAAAWVRFSSEGCRRTPMERCPAEYEELFEVRYRERFGEGMVLQPNKTKLVLSYRPASRTFNDELKLPFDDLPDVTALKVPLQRLNKLSEEVQNELDPLSRWIGRKNEADSIGALALVPAPLLSGRGGFPTKLERRAADLVRWDDALVITKAADLLEGCPGGEGEFGKREAAAFAQMFEALGYGIEPDPRFGSSVFGRTDTVVVFRLPKGAALASPAFSAAAALLHLATAVAGADGIGPEEELHLLSQVRSASHLTPAEATRLEAHLRWLLASPPPLTGLKQRVAALAPEQRKQVARVVIGAAGADGQVSPAEMKALAKVYAALGLDPDSIYSDVHSLATGANGDLGPVEVMPAEPSTGRRIPRPLAKPPAGNGGVVLDPGRLAAIQAETAQVTEVLSGIFAQPDPAVAVIEVDEPEQQGETPSPAQVGRLDAAHSSLVRELLARDEWSRSEFNALAERHGLMPGGAMETINEAAFDAAGEPALEGDDPVEVNTFALEEMLA